MPLVINQGPECGPTTGQPGVHERDIDTAEIPAVTDSRMMGSVADTDEHAAIASNRTLVDVQPVRLPTPDRSQLYTGPGRVDRYLRRAIGATVVAAVVMGGALVRMNDTDKVNDPPMRPSPTFTTLERPTTTLEIRSRVPAPIVETTVTTVEERKREPPPPPGLRRLRPSPSAWPSRSYRTFRPASNSS